MEIYNEQVMDLLVPASERTNLKVSGCVCAIDIS
jgi:hypothetical protein